MEIVADPRCLCGADVYELVGLREGFVFGRCGACGLLAQIGLLAKYDPTALYLDGYHTAEQERIGHVSYYERFDHDLELGRLRVGPIRDLVGDSRGLRLLDVGASNGAFVLAANEGGFSAEGIEINPALSAWARQRTGAQIIAGPFEHTGYPDDLFDAVTLHDVIEHFVSPEAVLLAAARILRPGGLVVVDTPDAGAAEAEEAGLDWKHIRPKEHLWYFSEEVLVPMLARAGFDPVRIDRPIPGKLAIYARKGGKR